MLLVHLVGAAEDLLAGSLRGCTSSSGERLSECSLPAWARRWGSGCAIWSFCSSSVHQENQCSSSGWSGWKCCSYGLSPRADPVGSSGRKAGSKAVARAPSTEVVCMCTTLGLVEVTWRVARFRHSGRFCALMGTDGSFVGAVGCLIDALVCRICFWTDTTRTRTRTRTRNTHSHMQAHRHARAFAHTRTRIRAHTRAQAHSPTRAHWRRHAHAHAHAHTSCSTSRSITTHLLLVLSEIYRETFLCVVDVVE